MATLRFDTEACSRCGGTGQYSYCQMHGTTCFKCSGKKVQQTRAGARAFKAWLAFADAHCTVAAKDVAIGSVIIMDGKQRRVLDVQTTGGSRWLDNATGEWHDYTNIKTKACSYGVFPNSRVRVPATIEQFREFVATQKKGVQLVDEAEAK